MKYQRILLAVIGMTLSFLATARGSDTVVNSKHDLSAQGPGPIRAVNENEICIFCHTPHNAAPQTPLWNHESANNYYRIYQSSTTNARIRQPSGPSKLCLSCHDGSIALGNVLSRPASEPILMTSQTMPPGRTDLTRDLSDDHPIGFRYDRVLSNADHEIRAPEVVTPDLPLGAHGEVHCTTCHDPHNNELGNFLRISDQMSAICVSCHAMSGWNHASHALSHKPTIGRTVDPNEELRYGSVGENGCLSCHKVHSAPKPQRLLRFSREEDNCLNCHSGSVAAYNIASEIGKRFSHNGQFRTGVHDPKENPFTMRRHSECVDCHNPHAVEPDHIGAVHGTLGQTVKGPNLHVSGVSITGRQIDDSTFLYEICLKCHGDGVQRPRLQTSRQISQTNTRLEFQTSNPSFHPVAGPRRNSDVVSLLAPLRSGSVITCTDCHNSDDARSAGGSGPNGPHGSMFAPLLVRNYDRQDFAVESPEAYSLCYGCHSRDSILNDESFPLHRRHIVTIRTPCSACHDAHGIYRGQGNSTNHSNLINFDLSIVQSANTPSGRRLQYEDTGTFSGNCTLTCHGVVHINFPYANTTRGGVASKRNFSNRGATR